MTKNTGFTSNGGMPPDWLGAHVKPFLEHLRSEGYAEKTLRKKRSVAAAFAEWIRRKYVSSGELNESHVPAFAKRQPRKNKSRITFELGILRLFLGYLRRKAVIPIPPSPIDPSPAGDLLRRYVDYLRNVRGLAERSIDVYSLYIRGFLSESESKYGIVSPKEWDAQSVQDFLLDRVRDRSNEYSRLLTVSLRSFLRFLYLRGETETDISPSIPMVSKWQHASTPTFLSPEDVERVLSSINRLIPRGRRDYAILLLLSRLGLRAGEIVALDLDDIQWRTAEIIVHGKGRLLERMPLLVEIGESLELYLRQGRGNSLSRRVFLRINAPCVGLTGPAAVGHIVRRALARAGIRRTSRGAAHIFRHSLATRMIRNGASIAEISEVLRHQSQQTTAVYAKVDFEALRGVARTWPDTGGVQ